MGLIEAFEDGIIGIFLAFIIGQVTVSLFPSLSTTFNNATVFGATGAVTLGLIAFISLIFVVVIILRMIRQAREQRENIRRDIGV